MDLILWRHAEAADGLPDHARELTAKGIKQAARAAAFLRLHLSRHVRVLVSPAMRTQQTAQAFSEHFTLVPALAPGCSGRDILEAAQWPHADGMVLVVGHQPGLGEVAAQLLDSREQSLSIKKGALWWFSQHRQDTPERAVLRLAITPDFM